MYDRGLLIAYGLLVWVVFPAALVYGGRLYRRRRRNAMTIAGKAIGFTSAPDDSVNLPARLCQGARAKYVNVLTGRRADCEALIFDFWYWIRNGKGMGPIGQTVAAFHLLGANMPDFQLMPRTLATKLSKPLFDEQQLKFNDNSEFSSHWMVRGADPETASSLFTPGLLSFFQNLAINRLTVEGYWDWIVVSPGCVVKPSDLSEFVETASQIAVGFSGHVPRPLLAK